MMKKNEMEWKDLSKELIIVICNQYSIVNGQ